MYSDSILLFVNKKRNIMGSRGSVIPLFVQQLSNKILSYRTDPKMTRFFDDLMMQDLVLFAFEMG